MALVACFGNVLRGDDGFGPAVARRLATSPLPWGVEVLEVGIGGIHLVQALLDPVELLVIVDAVDRGLVPGTVIVQKPEVPDVRPLATPEQRDAIADVHYATPERAMLLAKGLGVLPARTFLVGCQVADSNRLGDDLSPEAAGAIDAAIAEVHRLLADEGVATAGGE